MFLAVAALLPLCAVPASAGDYVMAETLIDEVSYIYTANTVTDSASPGKQYAYTYMNMAALLGMTAETYNRETVSLNPNRPFALNGTDNAFGNGVTNFQIFKQLEGYWDADGSPIVKDADKSKAADDGLALNKNILKKKIYKNGSPLSFPYYATMTVTAAEESYAREVQSALTASLNGILFTVNEGSFGSVTELINKSIMIRPDSDANTVFIPGSDHSGYMVIYADLTGDEIRGETSYGSSVQSVRRMDDITLRDTEFDSWRTVSSSGILEELRALGADFAQLSSNDALLCYIIPYDISGGSVTLKIKSTASYEYAYPKGYADIVKDGETLIESKGFETESGNYSPEKKDYPWITVHMLAAYANTVYKNSGICVENYEGRSGGWEWLTDAIGEFLDDCLDALTAVLGLTQMDRLVFNTGTEADNYGLMSEQWWQVVVQYSLLFQTFAWIILVFGLLRMALNLNLSSVNPQKRTTLYSLIEKFVLAGIGLVILIPAVRFLLECNSAIVELFASQVDAEHGLARPASFNVIIDFIIGFVWLALLFYINFVYIYRGVVTGLLVASGPFFISTIALSDDPRSSLFGSWAKELTANIFVQSVHAFVLSFLVKLTENSGSRNGITVFAIAFSIIPLTEMFRQLIFSGAGGSVGQFAQNAGTAVIKTASGAARGIGDFAGKRFEARAGEEDPESIQEKGGGGGGSRGGGRTQDSGFHAFTKQRQTRYAREAAAKRAAGDEDGARRAQNRADALASLDTAVGFGGSVTDIGSEIAEGAMTGRVTAGLGRSFQNAVGAGGMNRLAESGAAYSSECKKQEDSWNTAGHSGSERYFGGAEAGPSEKFSYACTAASYNGLDGQGRPRSAQVPERPPHRFGANMREVRHNPAMNANMVSYDTSFGNAAEHPRIEADMDGNADITYASADAFRNAMLAIGHRDTAYAVDSPEFISAADSGEAFEMGRGVTLRRDADGRIVQHISRKDSGIRCDVSHGATADGKPVERFVTAQGGGRNTPVTDVFGIYARHPKGQKTGQDSLPDPLPRSPTDGGQDESAQSHTEEDIGPKEE